MIAGVRRGAAGFLLVGTAVAAWSSSLVGAQETPLAGSAGIDTTLPLTDSAQTRHGRGLYGDLTISVNQTDHLTNQAISVVWSGAPPGVGLANNTVQIFQCWGDDDGTVPENPGPPPEQCEFGGEPIVGVRSRIPSDTEPSAAYSRVISKQAWGEPFFDPSAGYLDSQTGFVWKPFRSVSGRVVPAQTKVIPPKDSFASASVEWLNPDFDFTTSNEQPWGRTYRDGTGAALFGAATGLEAPGLGCGQDAQALTGGGTKKPQCWLVVVPRGTAAQENPSSLLVNYVATSPLNPQAWANRIAFPLAFNDVSSPCRLGANERRIVGGELATAAITNWQPKLCATPGSAPFAYAAISDNQARSQVASGSAGAAGMAVVSRPINPDLVHESDPVIYAPLTLSGVTLAFNIERQPVNENGRIKDPAELPLLGKRVGRINLTPRLVAKLLTQSYRQLFFKIRQDPFPSGYGWLASAPIDITEDPDFLQFNPEFTVMTAGTKRTTSAVTVSAPSSDAARTMWEWLLADPEAKNWLDGMPDPWGMKVNPYYATTDAANVNHAAFASPVPDTYPQNDPFCYQDEGLNGIVPRPLCLLDVHPLTQSLSAAAQVARSANDRALTDHDVFNPSQQTANTWWGAEGPQLAGSRSIIAITDSASAVRFGLQTAHLSRAGDDGPNRAFIAPTDDSMGRGAAAMAESGATGMLVPDPKATAAGAYPLTALTYAAIFPRNMDQATRDDYARFVEFAIGAGQVSGVEFGQLPPGYAPLPSGLRAVAADAVAGIRAGVPEGEHPEETDSVTGSDVTSSNVAESVAPAGEPAPGQSPTGTGAFSDQPTSSTAAGSSRSGTGGGNGSSPSTTDSGGGATDPGAATSPGNTPAAVATALLRLAIPVLLALALLAGLGVAVLDDRWLRSVVARHKAGLPRPQVRLGSSRRN